LLNKIEYAFYILSYYCEDLCGADGECDDVDEEVALLLMVMMMTVLLTYYLRFESKDLANVTFMFNMDGECGTIIEGVIEEMCCVCMCDSLMCI